MSTHDELKTKGVSVPKRELPILISRQKTPSTWSPAQSHDWGWILSTSDMSQISTKGSGVDGVRNGGDWHAHQPEGRTVGLQIILGMTDMTGFWCLVVVTMFQVNHSRIVIVNNFPDQVLFCGPLFCIFVLVSVANAMVATLFASKRRHAGRYWNVILLNRRLLQTNVNFKAKPTTRYQAHPGLDLDA